MNNHKGGLFNFSGASNYLNINVFWLRFLISHNLIRLTFLPGYKKPKIYHKDLDDFIESLQSNPNQYSKIFLSANKLSFNRYSNLEVENDG
ncbi:MAG: hypothetical protein WAR79_13280 [Melioribacteraceae bacterium]